MTKISLITQGQQLICANKVVIAAGDINSVELKVEFDSAWDDYPAKSATFYTSSNPTVQEMLMLNNSCIVPFEVMTESCVLFIGVRGVSADGERVKTSTLAKYKISEGATAGDKTLTPTMDLYQQYLAALKTEADPVLMALKEELQASIQAVETATMEKIFSVLDGVVLWECEDIGSFWVYGEDAVVEFDTSEHKTFRVLVGNRETTVTEKGKETAVYEASSNKYTKLSITDSGMTFYAGDLANVPCKVIGYKY